MIIGIDIRSLSCLPRTGVGEYAHEIVTALINNKSCEYVLFSNSFSDKVDTGKWQSNNVTVVQTKLPNKIFHLLLLLNLVAIDSIIKRKTGKKIDYFFTPNFHFTKLKWAKQVLMVHDLSFILYKECYSIIDRLWHKLVQPKKQMKSALLIAPSQSTKQDIQHVLDNDKKEVTIISHGVSSLFNKTFTENMKKQVIDLYKLPPKYIIMIGTVEPRKNMLQAINGFLKSKLSLEGYELLIAGSFGYQSKNVVNLAKKTAGVRLLGYISASHKATLLAEARALIYPSLYEGFGLPIIEALALGTPVLTSNRSSMPEVSVGEAVLVNPDSSDDIANGIKEVITKNKAVVRCTDYDWKVAADKLHTLFIRDYKKRV